MRKPRTIKSILFVLCGLHLLAVAYLGFALPSMGTLFAEETWVLPQLGVHRDKGTIDEFVRTSTRANALMQKCAISHLFAAGGLSLLTAGIGGYVLYALRKQS